MTLENSGGHNVEKWYKSRGRVKFTSGSMPTDITYTGQRSETESFGLMFYTARWYDPYLKRWAQPDSFVPNIGIPVDWDRFSYVRNNPIRSADPSGHYPCGLDVYVAFCKFTYKVVLGGIGDFGAKVAGPNTKEQAPAWVRNSQLAQDYTGSKYGQAEAAFHQIMDSYDPNEYGRLQIIGLSAGADSALILALMLKDAGVVVDDLILLGPTFSGDMQEYGDLADLDTLIEILNELTNSGMNIWVIDDQAPGGDNAKDYQASDGSGGTFTYIDESDPDGWGHVQAPEESWGEENWGSGYINNDPYIRYEIMQDVYAI